MFKKSLFIKYLLSSFLIVAILIAAFTPIYILYVNKSKEYIQNTAYNVLNERFKVFNSYLVNFRDIAAGLRTSEGFRQLALAKGDFDTSHYYDILSAQKSIYATVYPSDFIIDAYFMFYNNDAMVSKKLSCSPSQGFYGYFFKVDNVGQDDYFKTLKSSGNQAEIRPSVQASFFTNFGMPMKTYDTIQYIVRLPWNSFVNYDSLMVFCIDSEKIKNLFTLEELSDGGFFGLINANGEVIAGANRDYANLPENLSSWSDAKVTYFKFFDEITQLTLVYGIPTIIFQEKIKNVSLFMQIFIFLTGLIGLLLSAFFSFKHSSFITDKLKKAEVIIKKPLSIERIDETIKEINDIAELNGKKLEQVNELMKSNLFEKLLKNELVYQEDLDAARSFLELSENCYFIAALGSICCEYKEFQLINVLVTQFLKEQFSGKTLIHNSEYNKIVFLMETGVSDVNTPDKAVMFLTDLADNIFMSTGKKVVIGISRIWNGGTNLSTAYFEAKSSLSYNITNQEGSVFIYNTDSFTSNNILKIDYINRLNEIIRMGLTENAIQIIKDVNYYLSGIRAKEEVVLQTYYSIRNVMYFVYEELFPDEGESGLTTAISHSSYIHELFENLMADCIFLCSEINKKKKSRNTERINHIIEYIKNNFMNPSISLQMMADEFKISEGYLSNYFKEQTNQNFSDFLERKRMEEAQRLLLETDININLIPQQIGYNSNNTFYKTFSRVFGISPGKWRDKMKKP